MKKLMVILFTVVFSLSTNADIIEVNNTAGSGVYADSVGNLYIHDVNVAAVTMIKASYTCNVADANCDESVIIDASGDGLGNALDRPSAVVVDSLGNIYVAGQFSDNVFRILNPAVCVADCIREVVDASGASVNGFDTALALTVDANDNVYVAGGGSDNVIRIPASETCATTGTPCSLTEIIDLTGDDGAGPNELNQPIGLASDSQGSVYVTTQNSDNIFKIATPETCSTTGTLCTITELVDQAIITDQAFGRGIVVDSEDNIYFTSLGFFQPAAVFKINTPGSCSTAGTPCIINEIFNMDTPQQAGNMTIDDADNIFFAGGNGDNAYKINTPTNCSTSGTACVITEIINASGDGSSILDGTSNVAFAFGQIYVSGGGSDNVFRVTDVAVSNDLIFYDGF